MLDFNVGYFASSRSPPPPPPPPPPLPPPPDGSPRQPHGHICKTQPQRHIHSTELQCATTNTTTAHHHITPRSQTSSAAVSKQAWDTGNITQQVCTLQRATGTSKMWHFTSSDSEQARRHHTLNLFVILIPVCEQFTAPVCKCDRVTLGRERWTEAGCDRRSV